ncbi:MAG: very short patch repair endonuclease [Clostridiales Family XIII bacterium]|nr:very short patch repair endonuclease [Clostridiales Family XIII bacterium]
MDTRTDEEKRSYTMSRIKCKATTIEVLLQKALWRRGIRYRKNYRVTGTPDIAIVKYKIAIFCDGEFWHGKDWAQKKHRLKNNREYWINKIERNIERDKRFTKELQEQGWRVLRFWETDIKSDLEACVDTIVALVQELKEEDGYYDLSYHGEPQMAAEKPKDDYSP